MNAIPDDAALNITINNAAEDQSGNAIAMVMTQPSAFADATMTAINQNTGAVLLTATLPASGAQAAFGCKSLVSCLGGAVRDWLVGQGLDYIKNHWHDVSCATVFPSYGSCDTDVTQWVPATQLPPGEYYIPTIIVSNPGFGWVPYDPSSNPADPNNPDPVARQQCNSKTVYCGVPVDNNGTPLEPKK